MKDDTDKIINEIMKIINTQSHKLVPPKFYDDGSFTLKTQGCDCCSHNFDIDEENYPNLYYWNEYRNPLPRDIVKKIYIAYIKQMMKYYEINQSDIVDFDLCNCGAPAINTDIPNLCDNCHGLLSKG